MAKKKKDDNDYKVDLPITNDIAPIEHYSASDDKNPVDQLYEAVKKLNEVTIPAINLALQSLDNRVTALEGRINSLEGRVLSLESRI